MNAQPKPAWVKTISEIDRIECLALAEMNLERAAACNPQQTALRTFLQLNAKKFQELAK